MKPNDQELRELYESQLLSYAEIGRRFEVSNVTVMRWLRAAGVTARTTSEANRVAKRREYSPETIERMRARAAVMRTKITAESLEKHRQKMLGRTSPTKGTTWSTETRANHAAYRQTPEYREKLAAAQRGAKSHNWQGGKTPESSLHGWEWRRRRHECYQRDNWTCQDCGVKCLNTKDSKNHPKRKIQAHHLISRRNGGGDELENLVTLCMSCHHKRERRYVGAFIA